MRKPLKRNTEIVKVKYFTFPIGNRLSIAYAEACTNRGVKLFAYTRQSILDKSNESMIKQVLDGRMRAVLSFYKKGKSVRGKVAYAGMVPTRSSAVERRNMTKKECIASMRRK